MDNTLEFFKYLASQGDKDAERASQILTNSKEYQDGLNKDKGVLSRIVQSDSETDSTCLTSLDRSLDYIELCNHYREYHSVKPLRVTSTLLAISMLHANASRDVPAHCQGFNVSENLSWGTHEPFDKWYRQEREAQCRGEPAIGYSDLQNILDSSNTLTGYGYVSGGCGYGTGEVHCQIFVKPTNKWFDEEYACTVEEYRAKLEHYRAFRDLTEADVEMLRGLLKTLNDYTKPEEKHKKILEVQNRLNEEFEKNKHLIEALEQGEGISGKYLDRVKGYYDLRNELKEAERLYEQERRKSKIMLKALNLLSKEEEIMRQREAEEERLWGAKKEPLPERVGEESEDNPLGLVYKTDKKKKRKKL